MADDYLQQVSRLLKEYGITKYRVERLAKHRVLIVERYGETRKVVFAATGSDWRGPANFKSSVRHALNLFGRPEDRSPPPPRVQRSPNKRRAPALRLAEKVPARVDRFYAPLLELKARLEVAAAAGPIGIVGLCFRGELSGSPDNVNRIPETVMGDEGCPHDHE
jgi:hypothetical protein